MAIQVLDQNTINKIAAGEVIERPSSVVKELVENAIDAKATAITIEIKDGGISFIRITDNGSGIEGSELSTAFLRHSTSKIKSIEDLACVSSLGFRGEALSSIAAISQIELITKTKESFTGYRYVIEGGKEVSNDEIGAPDGTTFIIRNMFYNTPVRRKFLKTPVTEAGYVSALVEHLALSHPDISFRFINNNQNKLHTSGNGNLKDIIYHVYGRDISNNLIELNSKTQDIEITGFVGKPAISRGNRNYENYYINGRYIKSGIITKAIEEAYKGFVMMHNYPFTAIHFQINSQIMDVNVHPTKMELRFSQNEFVYNFVLNTVREALTRRELIPNVTLEDVVTKEPQTMVTKEPQVMKDFKRTEYKPLYNPPVENIPAAPVKQRLPEPFEKNRFEKMVKEEEAKNLYKTDINKFENKTDINTENKTDINTVENRIKNDTPEIKTGTQIDLFEEKFLEKKNENQIKIIGQLFDTYWLFEFEEKFFMMDQHAAHEKILFERFMKKLQSETMDTQMIIPPVILSLNMREEEVYKENELLFTKLGYEIEEFGGNEYKITGIPANLPMMDVNMLLIDILDGLVEDNLTNNTERITEKVASMSCKAAVKGNNKLSLPEIKELLEELMQAENPYNCPHGRPTLISMTKYEIEKKFKRIV